MSFKIKKMVFHEFPFEHSCYFSFINEKAVSLILRILGCFFLRYQKWVWCVSLVNLNLYTQRNIFEILLNETEIRLYLPFSDWFGSKRRSVWFQINRKMVNTIRFQFHLIRFRKDFSVCNYICTYEHIQIFIATLCI